MNREEELLQIIKELRKGRKIWNNRIWRLNNKIKVSDYNKNYNKNNKEAIKKQRNFYLKQNKEALKKQQKAYRVKNKDKIKKREKDNCHTIERRKIVKKCSWKKNGLNMENFEQIWKRYCETTHCDNCNVLLTLGITGSFFKCMDHSHITGEFRNILCQTCNVRRGENNL